MISQWSHARACSLLLPAEEAVCLPHITIYAKCQRNDLAASLSWTLARSLLLRASHPGPSPRRVYSRPFVVIINLVRILHLRFRGMRNRLRDSSDFGAAATATSRAGGVGAQAAARASSPLGLRGGVALLLRRAFLLGDCSHAGGCSPASHAVAALASLRWRAAAVLTALAAW